MGCNLHARAVALVIGDHNKPSKSHEEFRPKFVLQVLLLRRRRFRLLAYGALGFGPVHFEYLLYCQAEQADKACETPKPTSPGWKRVECSIR